MKKLISVFLTALLLLISVISVPAATVDIAEEGETYFTIGDWVYQAIDGDSHLEIDKYIGSDTDVVIPRIVMDRMVVSIGNHCFLDNKTVKKVETSSPLWRVGDYAFMNCSSLETFICNFALNDIRAGAFIGATSLKQINLEDSVVTTIKPQVFSNSGITEVTLPDTYTEIMHDAFAQCPDLVKLVIPRSVTVIGDDAFARSDNLVIYCYTDSAAHQYAEEKNIPFVLLDAELEGYLLGDTDDSGDVDVVDATWIQRYAAYMNVAPVEDTLMQGDVDGDGDPSVVDATFIMRSCVGISTPYDIGEIVTDN